MHETHSLRERFLVFFKIFVPILIYQFANFSAAFVDTTMTGQYDTLHLAGVAMATSLWSPFFTFLTGIVSALVPIIGHHLGAGRKDRVAPDFYQFLYMALGLSLILFALVFLGAPLVLSHLGLEPVVRKVALGYLRFLSLGIIPLLLFSVARSFLDSLGLTRLSMYLMLLLLPLNGFFNFLLIYGIAGLPELGGAGAGLGTSLAYWALLLISIAVIRKHKKIKPYHIEKVQPLDKAALLDALKLGLPIGGTVFAEVAIFSGVGLVMAKYPSLVIASHQAAMHEPDFLRMTAIFMTYSLFFQVTDVFAAPLQGILRGYKDTKVPFYLGVLTYWGITLPVGFLLEKVTGLGPYSYWIGLIASLIVSGLCYQWRLNKIVKRYESQQ